MKPENDMQIFRELTIGVENIIDSMLRGNKTIQRSGFPKKNIIQTSEDSYRIDFSLAGYSKDQIEIFVDEDNMLNVSSNKVEDNSNPEEEYPKYLVRDIALRAFHVKIKLIDAEVSSAKMENGVLSITVQKRAPAQNKVINVE